MNETSIFDENIFYSKSLQNGKNFHGIQGGHFEFFLFFMNIQSHVTAIILRYWSKRFSPSLTVLQEEEELPEYRNCYKCLASIQDVC